MDNQLRQLFDTMREIDESLEEGRHPREKTLSIIELMDEGILDPRQVADAALAYMSEAEVDDMARQYEWFGDEYDYDAADDDDFDAERYL